MSMQNPMGLTNPNSSGNYVQPDTVAHPVAAQVASYPTGANVLNIAQPVAVYTQPGAPPFPAVTGAFLLPLGVVPGDLG